MVNVQLFSHFLSFILYVEVLTMVVNLLCEFSHNCVVDIKLFQGWNLESPREREKNIYGME